MLPYERKEYLAYFAANTRGLKAALWVAYSSHWDWQFEYTTGNVHLGGGQLGSLEALIGGNSYFTGVLVYVYSEVEKLV